MLLMSTTRPGKAANPERVTAMTLYILPSNPAIPMLSFPALRGRAKRLGYRIQTDRYSKTHSLIDAQTGLPLTNLDHVPLIAIANVIEEVRTRA
jgi:hypothetical protein